MAHGIANVIEDIMNFIFNTGNKKMTPRVIATERKNRWPDNIFPWVTTNARGAHPTTLTRPPPPFTHPLFTKRNPNDAHMQQYINTCTCAYILTYTASIGELLDNTMMASLWPRKIWSDKIKSPANHKEDDLTDDNKMHKDRKIADFLNFTGITLHAPERTQTFPFSLWENFG